MIVKNVEYFRGQPVSDYLAMPGTSFSSMKGEITPSAGMMLGTRVHNYINEPEKYDWEQVDEVRKISAHLRKYLGDAIKYLESEIAVTADFIHNGLVMKYKGRIDRLKIGRLVIDFKILSGPLEGACKQFGYPDQISGYCIPTECPRGLILAYNKRTKKIETKIINPNVAFWEYQVLRWGNPL